MKYSNLLRFKICQWIGGFLLNVSQNYHNCVQLIYLIHKFHNLSWITEINELFHDILIYWDAPVFKNYLKLASGS